jgi:DNA-binding response OmpR family regulator
MSARARVLIIDQDTAARDLVAHALTVRGLDVTIVRDRESALRQVSTRPPAAILVNLGLQSEAEILMHAVRRLPSPRVPLLLFCGADDAPDETLPDFATISGDYAIFIVPDALPELVALLEALGERLVEQPV